MTDGSRRRRTRRMLGFALAAGIAVSLGAVASVAGAPSAVAHTQVAPASPKPGSTVTSGPVTVALTTTDPILASGQKSIVVEGPGGTEQYFGDGCTEVTNGETTLSAEVTLGEPGEYTVIWTLVAEDGHTQSSNDFAPFTFTWEPEAGEETATGSDTVPTCGEDSADAGTDEPGTDESGADDSEASDGAGEESGEEAGAPGADSSDADVSDLAWLIGAAGIIFIATAIVVMIAVRRRMLQDDDDPDNDDPDDDDPGTGATSGPNSSSGPAGASGRDDSSGPDGSSTSDGSSSGPESPPSS
ncbi:copper resistance protein CopC [Microbacterium sp. MPKO10]|uniref:copper resistance CopC family protein n=1 Tax=Microbacterium sp. MPKO10 TaxID=2989818 RepID=UPI002235E115|nr:copper resistance protein CopC [Microbacterium sp. MPKO10]MCW4458883.1 copper resistance protein CopC [Microbacterium sp. MPKO10]